MKNNTTPEYQCCFCNETIKTEDENAVLLTATNFKDWQTDNNDPRFQSFYAHFHCLQLNWNSEFQWETEALINTN